jgi:hypothetical protein
VEELLRVAHGGLDAMRRRGHEVGVPRPGAADPVLAPPKLAGALARPPTARQQDLVYLPDQAVREREPGSQPPHSMLERADVVRHFDDVVERNAWSLLQLEQ